MTQQQMTEQNESIVHAKDRGWLIHIMVILAALLFVATASLLYFRWLAIQEPTSILILTGTDALDGAKVRLTGVNMGKPVEAVFNEQDHYVLKFFLEPGSYSFSIRRGDELIHSIEEFTIPGRTQVSYDLSRQHPSTQPSAKP